MRRAVDLGAGESRRRFRHGRDRIRRGLRARQIQRDARFIAGTIAVWRGVARDRRVDFVEPPVGARPGRQHRLRVGSMRLGDWPAFGTGDTFEQAKHGLDDPRLGLRLEPRGARGPRRVATKNVLLGRRDIAVGAVGEFDVERRAQRTLRLQLEARDGIDLVGQGGETEVADARGLQLEFTFGLGRNQELFERVDFTLVGSRSLLERVRPTGGPIPDGHRRPRAAVVEAVSRP